MSENTGDQFLQLDLSPEDVLQPNGKNIIPF
jgi:hypothetical protein